MKVEWNGFYVTQFTGKAERSFNTVERINLIYAGIRLSFGRQVSDSQDLKTVLILASEKTRAHQTEMFFTRFDTNLALNDC